MKEKMPVMLLSGSLFLAMSGSASASLLDFTTANLGVAGGTYNSVVMTVDGITVTITAYTIENDGLGAITSTSPLTTAGTGVYVSSSSNNIGVKSSSADGTNMDGGASTGDPDEGLLFSFSQPVSLGYINFDSFTSASGDDFNLTVDNTLILADYNANDISSLVTNVSGQFDEYNFNGITGTEYLFWADGDSDSFRIDQMEVSAVPVPSAVWLFGSGLLGLVGVARRKVRG